MADALYARASQTARSIAKSGSFTGAETHRKMFEKLYWGELHFVESKRLNSNAVESAMVQFRKHLLTWKQGPPPTELTNLAAQLENACEQAMGK
ncbi:MAG: hypothetical protein VX768_17075 [Planctomycetota bacterium]|nr:hypothetical protein [Planctomycetota bacterium]